MGDGSAAYSGETTFKCSVCSKEYSKKEHLQRHERSHTGAKPFHCKSCDRRFSRADVLARHARQHHSPSRVARHGSSSNASCPQNASQGSAANGETEPAGPPPRQFLQNEASSLIWSSSEDLFESLLSSDAPAWDQPFQGPTGPAEFPPDLGGFLGFQCRMPSQTASTPSPGLLRSSIATDGHQAVQVANGLVSSALSDAMSTGELENLTPRFLDSSFHMFFTRFIPTFPVIHRPTFVFRDCPAPLLLNAIALGSLFLGTEDAVAKGEALWRLAHTAIATSWPVMIGQRREYDSCSGVQLVTASLLSQIYASLSKKYILRTTSQTFYGLTVHWAQYCGMYSIADPPEAPEEKSPEEAKMGAWKTWVARETQLRTILGLCVVDGVVSQYSGNRVTARPATSLLPITAHDEVFDADTPDAWARSMRNRQRNTCNFSSICHNLFPRSNDQEGAVDMGRDLALFDLRIVLEILNSLALDAHRSGPPPVGIPPKADALHALERLRQAILESRRLSTDDRRIALLRWHAICLDVVGDVSRGARRMCAQHGTPQNIFGGQIREESAINPQRWIHGLRGRKCLLHALEIQQIAKKTPLGEPFDLNLAGAIFAAASVFGSFSLSGGSTMAFPGSVDWSCVLRLGLEGQARDGWDRGTVVFLEGKGEEMGGGGGMRNLAYDLCSMKVLLHNISSQWGVAREMEGVVEAWMLLSY